jgi:hypothetical protein
MSHGNDGKPRRAECPMPPGERGFRAELPGNARRESGEWGAGEPEAGAATGLGVCPACGGTVLEIRGHTECRQCHRLIEGCCEGGRA